MTACEGGFYDVVLWLITDIFQIKVPSTLCTIPIEDFTTKYGVFDILNHNFYHLFIAACNGGNHQLIKWFMNHFQNAIKLEMRTYIMHCFIQILNTGYVDIADKLIKPELIPQFCMEYANNNTCSPQIISWIANHTECSPYALGFIRQTCKKGHIENLLKLLRLMPIAEITEEDYVSLIEDICASGHVEILRILWDQREFDTETTLRYIHIACENDHSTILEILIEIRAQSLNPLTIRELITDIEILQIIFDNKCTNILQLFFNSHQNYLVKFLRQIYQQNDQTDPLDVINLMQDTQGPNNEDFFRFLWSSNLIHIFMPIIPSMLKTCFLSINLINNPYIFDFLIYCCELATYQIPDQYIADTFRHVCDTHQIQMIHHLKPILTQYKHIEIPFETLFCDACVKGDIEIAAILLELDKQNIMSKKNT